MIDKIKDKDDVGDETLQNIRYQHAYGVILLTGAYEGKLPYSSIWCEHHDDILCETEEGKFDVFQIKTRGNAQGEWIITGQAIQKSLKKFCELHQKYEEYLGKFCFVSNMTYREVREDIQNQKRLGKSPINFISAINKVDAFEKLKEPYKSQLKELSENTGVDINLLFTALKKTEFIKGPAKDDFETVVAYDHVGNLTECKSFSKPKLNKIRDVLIEKISYSSLLTKRGESMYWYFLNPDGLDDPELISKKIDKDYIKKIISDEEGLAFEFISTGTPLVTPQKDRKPSKIKVKMERGLLGDVVETMTRRALSAEEHLIKLSYRKLGRDFDKLLNQLSSIAKAECDDSRIKASDGKSINGRKMYGDVVDSFKELANNHPEKVYEQDYNVLLGIAGLLTDECKVWWSEKFNIDDIK